MLFSLHDIRTLQAQSPREGLELLQREQVDLVIQDMNFEADTTSGDEGTALFHQIRARHPDLPVILLTAWTHLESAIDLVKAGAADYLAKPWDDRKLLATVNNLLELAEARSELAWASAMAENGILKIGKVTDFQCHMIEHQLGAYTNCNHGAGLAVIHPVLYRQLLPANTARFARFAQNVGGIDPAGKSELKLAQAGVEALAAFIKEIGMPTTFAELGIPADTDLKAVADSTVLTGGCCKKLSREELLDILNECK